MSPSFSEKQPSLALGRALQIYSEIRCANRNLSEYEKWKIFLAAISNDAEMLAAVEKSMVPPQPPKRHMRAEKAFHTALSRYAQKHGIFAIEGKVREAVLAGRYGVANKLRNETLALMRQGASRVHHALVMASS